MWFSFAFISCSSTLVFAKGACVSLINNQSTYSLDGALSHYEDESLTLSLDDLLARKDSSWTLLQEHVPNFGFSSSVHWFKFELCGVTPEGEQIVLEVEYPLLDSITLYAVAGNSIVFEEHTGDSISFTQRPVEHRNFVFHLPSSEDPLSVYLRVESESAIQVPLGLYSIAAFSEHNQHALLIQGLYFGIILAMIMYNGFLFCTLRERPYLFYVLFAVSYFNFQGVFQGFSQEFLFDSVWWQNHALLIFGFLSIMFAIIFAHSFLSLFRYHKRLAFIFRSIAIMAIFSVALTPVLPYELMVKAMLAMAIVGSILIMFAGIKLWLAGHLPARIFTVAWSTLLVSFILSSLAKFGLLPSTFWTENILQIGEVIEVVLLSIALGERINEEKSQRIIVEQRLASSLEEQVQERTLELKQALGQLENTNNTLEAEQGKLETALKEIRGNHDELEETYNTLKSTQTQLLQAEKMQSVGRLAAGIAHEINTPIQYIGTNLEFLIESFSGSRELMGKYNSLAESGTCSDSIMIEEIEAAREDIDWEYLKEEIPTAITQSQNGIQQITSIVLAMKAFSHPGSSEKEPADINELIRTTVTISRNEWKNIAQLDMDLADNLPQVPCQRNEISQVILNLLINAGHAVAEQQVLNDDHSLGNISITTTMGDEYLQISISDTGGGIPGNILPKIFDPFFTTKEVGKGSGQGLAIAHDIINNKHGGKLEVEVKDNEGTTFTVLLPVKNT